MHNLKLFKRGVNTSCEIFEKKELHLKNSTEYALNTKLRTKAQKEKQRNKQQKI